MTNQDGNVAGALAERRREDGEDLEPVVEIAAELLLGDHLGEIAVGGGDEADIDGDGPVAAETLDLFLLQGAQELGLQVERNLADFVEKERALVGEFQAADLARDGPREGAFLVAEKFALDQPGGNSGAVDLDEGAFAPRAESVDSARQQFLAGPGLALDENGGIGGGDSFNLAEARGAVPCFRRLHLQSAARG